MLGLSAEYTVLHYRVEGEDRGVDFMCCACANCLPVFSSELSYLQCCAMQRDADSLGTTILLILLTLPICLHSPLTPLPPVTQWLTYSPPIHTGMSHHLSGHSLICLQ